jgi:glycosyltransferase involved in cell wall biosynthesis
MRRKKSLKILLPVHVFFPSYFYGTETYTLDLGKSLKAMGHDPVILTAIPYGEEGVGRLRSVYDYEGLTVHRIDLNLKPHSRFKQTYYRPELYAVLKDVVREIKPDLVHVTHLINHSATLLEVLRDARIPTVATLTDFFGMCFNNKLKRYDGELCLGPNRRSTNCLCCYVRETVPAFIPRFLWAATRSDTLLELLAEILPIWVRIPGFRKGPLAGHIHDVTCRIATLKYLYQVYQCMVAPTEFLFEAYARNGVDPRRMRRINFGIHLDLVKEYRTPKKKEGSDVVFGYIGQLNRHKGVDLLINAFRRVKGNGKKLVLYGDMNQDRQYAEELQRISSGTDRIEFKGTFPRTELGQRLSEIDVLVIPSRWYENSPLVLLYGLATRTPVIVTDVRGMNEFVQHGYNGYTFGLNDEANLAAILQTILDRPSLIESLSTNAEYNKDVKDHAMEVVDIYRSVLAAWGEQGTLS